MDGRTEGRTETISISRRGITKKSKGRGKALVNWAGVDEEHLETSEQQITKKSAQETSHRASKESDSEEEYMYTHIYQNDKFAMSTETENILVQWFTITSREIGGTLI
jgi:hypothetical protein